MDFIFYLKIETSTPSENISQKTSEISRHTTWEYSSTGKTHNFLPELFSFHSGIISNCSDSCKIKIKEPVTFQMWLNFTSYYAWLWLDSSPLLLTWPSSLGIWTLFPRKETLLRLMYLKTLSAKACCLSCMGGPTFFNPDRYMKQLCC